MENGKERISKELTARLENLVKFCFYINRIADRGLSLCEVRWKLLKFERLYHVLVAHAAPLLADKITSYMSKRNVEANYPDTTGGMKDYSSPLEFFDFMLEEFNNFEDEICNTIDFAAVEKDHATKKMLQNFLDTWIEYVATMNNICDLAHAYAPNSEPLGLQLFDSEVEHCFTVSDISPAPLVLEGD